jgi:Rrf2 family protein
MLGLTRRTEYGLKALVHLAKNGPDQLSSARAIADRNGMPVSLVMNVLKILAGGGLVESCRGVQGGYRLSRKAEDIYLIELIRLLEGPVRQVECTRPSDPTPDEAVCVRIGCCVFSNPVHAVHRRLIDVVKPLRLTDLIPPVQSDNVVVSDNPGSELNHGDTQSDLSRP